MVGGWILGLWIWGQSIGIRCLLIGLMVGLYAVLYRGSVWEESLLRGGGGK